MSDQQVDLHHAIVRTAIAPAEHVNAVIFNLGQSRWIGHPDRRPLHVSYAISAKRNCIESELARLDERQMTLEQEWAEITRKAEATTTGPGVKPALIDVRCWENGSSGPGQRRLFVGRFADNCTHDQTEHDMAHQGHHGLRWAAEEKALPENRHDHCHCD